MRTSVALLLTVLLVTCDVHAQAVPITHEGRPGVWLPVEDFRGVVRDRQRLTLLDVQLSLAVTETNELRAALGLEQNANAALQASLESARVELTASIERVKDAEGSGFWPGFGWGVASGLVIGAGVVLAAMFGTR